MMATKYTIQLLVALNLSHDVSASSLDEALVIAKAMAEKCPVTLGAVKVGRSWTYEWNEDTKIRGVFQ